MEETLSQSTMASKHPSIIQSHTRAEIILKGNLLFDCLNHKVDKTEAVSDQFPICIFNFWPYGQLRAIGEKSNNEL